MGNDFRVATNIILVNDCDSSPIDKKHPYKFLKEGYY